MTWIIRVLRTVVIVGVPVLALSQCRDSSRREPLGVDEIDDPVNEEVATQPTILVGAGDIGRCDRMNDELTANLLDNIPGTVFTLGDNAYADGSLNDYHQCYGPSWGRFLERTRPAVGERDYNTPDAAGYFAYFGARAGDPDKGYYSYDLGAWHIVVLNSNIKVSQGSPQEQWLRSDLAANAGRCILAYWHHPRFYSGGSNRKESLKPIWEALYEAGVAVVVNAHNKNYERFAPQTPTGEPDPERGIRQFIVGTGGASHASIGAIAPNSEVQDETSYGVLTLTLSPGQYAWEFIPAAGGSFTDSGTGHCPSVGGGSPPGSGGPPVANPAGPYSGGEGQEIQFDGSASANPGGGVLTYQWDFGDGSTGTGARPTHTYLDQGTYTATLKVKNGAGAESAPVATTVTITNLPPTVNAGADTTLPTGGIVALNATFSDPGQADAPWTYTVDWGDGSPNFQGSTTNQGTPIQAYHPYPSDGVYTIKVSVTDKDGGVGVDTRTVRVGEEPPAETVVLVGAGDIARCDKPNGERTAVLLDQIPGIVFTVGDHVEPDAPPGSYDECYGPSWGRHKARTRPAVGNNDYYLGSADAYFDYWGAQAGTRGQGYYSYDVGAWHVVVLNSNISMAKGSAQETWLRMDLAANTQPCILAYWHQPRFFTASVNINHSVKPLWDALYEAGATIIVNAHRHQYERFTPMTPDGIVDHETGIRQFIVGTGGAGKSSLSNSTRAPNSEVLGNIAYGVLKLTLEPGSYAWEFISEAKTYFTDSGTGTCR